MSNAMKYLLVLAFMLTTASAFSQDSLDKDKKFRSVKMYSNSDVRIAKNGRSFVHMLKTFSPSIAWGREYGNFQEVTIDNAGISFGSGNFGINLGVDYSYNLMIFKPSVDKKWNFYVGGGVAVSGGNGSSILSSTKYRSGNIDLDLRITPRAIYKLAPKINLELAVPYSAVGFSRFSGWNFYNSNPTSVIENTTTTFPNQFTVRVGVAIKF